VIELIIRGEMMRVIVTAKELIDAGLWDTACDVLGYNPWAVSEGMPSDTEITMTADQAIQIGLTMLPSKQKGWLKDWK